MTRRRFVAGNWKLHKTIAEAEDLARQLSGLLGDVRDRDVVVAPAYTALHAVARALKDSPISVAGQDVFYESSGAFTGAVSAAMLHEAGCTYVLVGHSERRQLFHETLETSRLRVRAALAGGLIPILCVGETLEEHEAGRADAVVREQFDAATEGLGDTDMRRLVLAYEPVWAIGTGQVATPRLAQSVHATLRARVRQRAGAVADTMRMLYGGSVKGDNAGELIAEPDIDGALVGGASLEAQSFADIVHG